MGCNVRFQTGLVLLTAALVLGAAPTRSAPLYRAQNPRLNPLLVRVADVSAGKAVFQSKCSVCHSVVKGGPTKFGPNLHGILGEKAGSVPGYNFSPAMKSSKVVWNEKTLDAYIADPAKVVPGNKMPFPGLPNKTERENLIAYIAQATR